jgi:hypothetical protein
MVSSVLGSMHLLSDKKTIGSLHKLNSSNDKILTRIGLSVLTVLESKSVISILSKFLVKEGDS